MKSLGKLLEKRLRLHSKKYALISTIFYQKSSYLIIYKAASQLRLVILKEIALNKRIAKRIVKLSKRAKGNAKKFIDSLAIAVHELTSVLYEEFLLLGELGLFNILMFNIEVFFFKDSKRGFFAKKCSKFTNALEEENRLSKKFADLARKADAKWFRNERRRFYSAKRLIRQLHEVNKKLAKSVGNIKLVKQYSSEILGLIEKLQNTDIYEFIKDDVDMFQKKVLYAMKHPKDHKFAYVLISAYIVAPGTFEITFAILFAKYITKYAIKTVKRISS